MKKEGAVHLAMANAGVVRGQKKGVGVRMGWKSVVSKLVPKESEYPLPLTPVHMTL